VINDYEAALRDERPEIRWIFVEPDLEKTPSQLVGGRNKIAG
jgi:hypothetical protein